MEPVASHADRMLPPRAAGALDRVLVGLLYVFLVSSYVSIAATSISLVLLAAVWALECMRERRMVVVRTGLEWFFLAYLVVQIVATVFSLDPLESLVNSRRLLLIGIVYFLVAHRRQRAQLQRATVVFHGAAAAVALIGVGKLLTGDPGEVMRLGVFQFYMTTSGMMVIAGLFALPFALHRDTPRAIRWGVVATLVPILVVLYATVTRGAYLAFLGGALLVVLVRNWKLVLPLAALLILGILLAPPYVAGRIGSLLDLSHPENVTRLMMWTAGIRIAADHPIVGVGDIDLGELMRAYADPGYPGVWGHLHNIPLQFLATHGFLGLMVIVAMFARIITLEWRAFRRLSGDWFAGSLTLGGLAVTAGLLLHGMTEWTFGDQEVVTLFWISLGLALSAARLTPPERRDA